MLLNAPRKSPRRLCSQKRHQSFPLLQKTLVSESNQHSDIPPNCQRQAIHKPAISANGPRATSGLDCEETMDSCLIPAPAAESEDEVDFDPAPQHNAASGSFIAEIHETPLCEEFAELEVEEIESTEWTARNQSYVYSLLEKETEYTCNPFALQLHQIHVTSVMRAVLFDWMMEVCSEFALKRETYYLAISYVDRFLSLHSDVEKSEFQLVGLTAMFLAAKNEEICNPRISDFARSADSGYSYGEIKAMELTLLRTLSWKIFPPTAFAWANLVMTLWDDYLACICESMGLLNPESKNASCNLDEILVQFKQANQHSYHRFRETMQILDVACLDVSALRYSGRHIVAGLMYLMISKYFYETDYRLFGTAKENRSGEMDSLAFFFGDGAVEVSKEEAGRQSQMQNAKVVQDLFIQFTRKAIEIHNIEEIYPTVAFLNSYLEFEASFELPLACKLHPKAKLESHYEDFLAFQTHNPGNVAFVSQQLRCQK